MPRMGEKRNVYMGLAGKQRAPNRCEYNIKMDFREMGL